MRVRSTLSESSVAGELSFRHAMTAGLAPDGGLYLPVEWPRIEIAELEGWRALPFAELAASLAERLLGDEFPPGTLGELVRDALDFPVPTRHIEGRHFVLELFHGPTLAFKDFGARVLARLLSHVLQEDGRRATVLVATSGDTGGAVAQGFFGVPNVHVVVVYPAGKISPFQEAQIATLGGNVTAVRLLGDFDDCQRLVKQAFLDPSLRSFGLTSANSINIGRLIPQSFYYVASYLAVRTAPGRPVVFSVPSGNLGNLTAGLIAARLGVPVGRVIAATNANAVFPEYVASGGYRPRPSVPTISSAMDVGDPSNLPRVVALHTGLEEISERIWPVSVDDRETRRTLSDTYGRTGYVLDPHSAVGYRAAQRYAARWPGEDPIVTLATAHPAKFSHVIREELGVEPALPPGRYLDWQRWPIAAVDLRSTSYELFRDLVSSLASNALSRSRGSSIP